MQQPFPQSQKETRGVGAGPDFPGSSGDRERGKFRPSATPGLTKVAVTGDDGQVLTWNTDMLLQELLRWQRATVLALALTTEGEAFTVDSLLTEVDTYYS